MNGPCKMTRTVHVRPSGKLNKTHSTMKNNGFSGSFLHILKSIQKKKIIEPGIIFKCTYYWNYIPIFSILN